MSEYQTGRQVLFDLISMFFESAVINNCLRKGGPCGFGKTLEKKHRGSWARLTCFEIEPTSVGAVLEMCELQI